jgi:outer membrane lipoprotein-sorting protein
MFQKLFFIRPVCLLILPLCGLVACQTVPEATKEHMGEISVSPQLIIQALKKRQHEVRNLRSYVKTTIERKDFKQTVSQIVLAQEHHSIRLDTLNLFKRPVGVFIHNDNKTLLYLPEENKLYSGWQVWDIMQKMLGTVIDFSEYISVFTGSIPRLEQLDFGRINLDPGKNYYEIEAVDPNLNEKIHIDMDARTLLPVRMIKRAYDRITYIAQWEDYEEVDGRQFPHAVVISRPSRGELLVMKFSDPLINKGVPVKGFELAIPKAKN